VWHRQFGGFGDDFFWPPHMLIYVSLGLNAFFASFGLTVALRGQGGVRQRARRETLMSLVALVAGFQFASAPSDMLWHYIMGPDLGVMSLPHLMLTWGSCATSITAAVLMMSSLPNRGWRGFFGRFSRPDLIALSLLALGGLSGLELPVLDSEFLRSAAVGRPAWIYPVLVLVVGISLAQLATSLTRRRFAATTVAVVMLLLQIPAAYFLVIEAPPTAILATPLLFIAPSLAYDVLLARHRSELEAGSTVFWKAGAIYTLVFLVTGLPYIRLFVTKPLLDAGSVISATALGAPLAAVALLFWGAAGARVWSRDATVMMPTAPRSLSRTEGTA